MNGQYRIYIWMIAVLGAMLSYITLMFFLPDEILVSAAHVSRYFDVPDKLIPEFAFVGVALFISCVPDWLSNEQFKNLRSTRRHWILGLKADKLTRLRIGRLHSSLSDTPFQANRVLAVIGSMYAFASRAGIVPEGTNPARGIDKFKESRRERFLTGEELERLGGAIRKAETTGLPWAVNDTHPTAKHVPKSKRSTRIAPSAAAALRLLLFTGCRLREILHLRWEHVDFERGCADGDPTKTGFSQSASGSWSRNFEQLDPHAELHLCGFHHHYARV